MSTDQIITQLLIHRLVKAGDAAARIVQRDRLNSPDAAAIGLVTQLISTFTQRSGKCHGTFEDDEEEFPVARLLREFSGDDERGFIDLGAHLSDHLRNCADLAGLDSGGTFLLARVREQAVDWLWIALVPETVTTAVDKDLNLHEHTHLDVHATQAVARIDLTGWRRGDERCVAFLSGRGPAAQCFRRFLGCKDVVVALQETRKLVQALTDFADSERLDPPVRDEMMERAHRYLDDLGEAGAPVELDALASELWPSAPARLGTTLQTPARALAPAFVPNRRALKPLVRLSASADQWRVEFERAGLRSGAVSYDVVSDTLVLSNLPPYLKQMLIDDGDASS